MQVEAPSLVIGAAKPRSPFAINCNSSARVQFGSLPCGQCGRRGRQLQGINGRHGHGQWIPTTHFHRPHLPPQVHPGMMVMGRTGRDGGRERAVGRGTMRVWFGRPRRRARSSSTGMSSVKFLRRYPPIASDAPTRPCRKRRSEHQIHSRTALRQPRRAHRRSWISASSLEFPHFRGIGGFGGWVPEQLD